MTKFCKHADWDDCFYCMFASLGVKAKDLKSIVYGFYQETKKSYSGTGCDRCGKIDEPYMLHNSVWNAVKINKERFLCIACVEIRLGNSLALKHFTDALINYGTFGFDAREYIRRKKKAQ